MARYSFTNASWTPTVVGDTTTMTANGAKFLQGGAATQRLTVYEIYMGGVATASSPMLMCVAYDSTVAVTAITLGTNGKNARLDQAGSVQSTLPIPGCSATTMPQRSATLYCLALGFNAFGGVVRWFAVPGSEIGITGLSASVGEISLSAFTGGTAGLMNSHILYESP
jgi:hypothetical protein